MSFSLNYSITAELSREDLVQLISTALARETGRSVKSVDFVMSDVSDERERTPRYDITGVRVQLSANMNSHSSSGRD